MNEKAPAQARTLIGRAAAEHLVRVAVGRDSSVVAEDQILHQIRRAASEARRSRRALPSELDRLLDVALHAGRVARTWLPSRRPSLADIAIELAASPNITDGSTALVVGTGEMGRAAAAYLLEHHARVFVASRTTDSARAAAQRFGITGVEFDPGPQFAAQLSGIVVALAGPWQLGPDTRQAIASSGAWVVDLSAPPALDESLSDAVRGRLVTIDDLGTATGSGAEMPSARLLQRLDELIVRTVDDFERWSAGEFQRDAAYALAVRAHDVRSAELERLWQRLPTLSDAERVEVERAFDHATEALLREPFEQLGRDNDGHQAEAVKELFRL